jgi:phytoene dehydrogenase-like protein
MADIVVIGTGVGGLGCAALLARAGHSVQAFERNSFIGGRCSASVHEGIVMENFAHIFPVSSKGALGRIAREVGEPVEFLRHDPAAIIYDVQRGRLRTYPQPQDIRPLKAQVRMAMNLGVKWYGAMGGGLFFMKLMNAGDSFIAAHDGMLLSDFVSHYTGDPQVHRFINTFCFMMFTISYTRASAGEFIYCFREMFKAAEIGYPRGGSGAITEAYRRGLEKFGGQVHLGRGVQRILTEGGRVTGVLTSDGEVPADVVVSNAGIDLTVELAGDEAVGREYADKARRMQYSGSGVVAKFLLDRQLLDMPAIIYMPDAGPDTMFAFLEEGGLPDDMMMMVLVVDRMDPSSIPDGKQLIIAATPGPPIPGDPRATELIDRLEERFYALVPGMKDHVIWKAAVRPEHISAATGRRRIGDSVGIAQTPGQVGMNKPSPVTPVEGLYLVGMDAGARGIGTWQAAASAELVAELVKERHPL